MLPIAKILGSLFTIIGFSLLAYGFFTNGDFMYNKSYSFNINIYWGTFMIVFGLVFIIFGREDGFLNQ